MKLILLGLLLACSSTEEKKLNKKANIYYNYGTQELILKKYTQALGNLQKAYELDPRDPRILNNLGMAYMFKEQWQKSEQLLKKALEIDPESSDARQNLASLYMQRNDNGKAEKLYQEVLKDLTYTKVFRTYHNLGLLNLKMGKRSEAERNFKLALKSYDYYCPSHFQIGLLRYKEKKFEVALKHFQQAEMGPCVKESAPRFYRALVYEKLKDYHRAKALLKEIIGRNEDQDFHQKAKTKYKKLLARESGENSKRTF